MAKPGPNDPCWCGSGRKYKKCHQARDLVSDLGGAAARPAVMAIGDPRAVKPAALSPRRTVPAGIPRPDYAETGRPHPERERRERIEIKTPEQIARLRKACRAAREVLEECKAAVRPGVTTDEIDRVAHEGYLKRGGYPSTLNYHGYPKSVCTSVNEVICHGIPDLRPLANGDILNIDVTIFLDGMHGDLSETVGVGAIDEASRRLIEVTHECLMRGIAAVQPEGLLRAVGRAIQDHAEANGYGVVRAFVGHGIGEIFHMAPQVPHYHDPSLTTRLKPGMTFTIEPMINQGRWEHRVWDDDWTAVTIDGGRSAQFEHTVLVTERGVEILTLPAGQPQPFTH